MDKVMMGLHRSICLQYRAFLFTYAMCIEGYQALLVTMLQVVNHLLVKAADVIVTDLT